MHFRRKFKFLTIPLKLASWRISRAIISRDIYNPCAHVITMSDSLHRNCTKKLSDGLRIIHNLKGVGTSAQVSKVL